MSRQSEDRAGRMSEGQVKDCPSRGQARVRGSDPGQSQLPHRSQWDGHEAGEDLSGAGPLALVTVVSAAPEP